MSLLNHGVISNAIIGFPRPVCACNNGAKYYSLDEPEMQASTK